ncbi:FAD/NAD(P)-binding domain-containing protein [Auricularia subglabra TFB-10046 SS5]|nr:FAD/NAD(P)-binding domain-containing protein [Auricularia subglabra TFB-10046 SS5]
MATGATQLASTWLEKFAALCAGDEKDLLAVFAAGGTNCWLRDLLVLSSDFRTRNGHDDIRVHISAAAAVLHSFKLELARLVDGSILLLFAFGIDATKHKNFIAPFDANGRGSARLAPQPDGQWKAWTVLLALHDFVGHEEAVGRAKLSIAEQTWDDAWAASSAAITENLAVLVGTSLLGIWARERFAYNTSASVGAGQSGLMTAARLKQLGIKTLLIERKKVGDSWGERYNLLKLHTPIQTNSFPYHPWPETWPKYLPKTKVAQFLRTYAEALDLHVWESTELLSEPHPVYDEATRTWTVHVKRDGSVEILRPRHVVLATGFASVPKIPDLPGRDTFKGVVLHSSQHTNASAWKGKRVVVIGACNSGADIAYDAIRHGALESTIIQRSKTTVMSMPAMEAFMFNQTYPDDTDLSLEQLDLMNNAVPHPAIIKRLRNGGFARAQEMDRVMLDGLAAAGFKTSDTPLYELLVGRGGGFIEDQGAIPQIIARHINVKNGVEVARLEGDTVIFTDGSTLPADVLVLATGYESVRHSLREIFGDELYKQTSDVWGIDAQGEIRGSYRPTGHEAFWYAVGFFGHARFLGRFLALQILASELERRGLRKNGVIPS